MNMREFLNCPMADIRFLRVEFIRRAFDQFEHVQCSTKKEKEAEMRKITLEILGILDFGN